MTRPDYAIYLGLDVGKEAHHACGLSPDGECTHDKALPQDEGKLRALFDKLSRRGRVLVVVDQPATIGALPVTVARDVGVDVAHLPGLAMRRIADLHPGNAKTDARDAYVIAEAARSMPHALRRVDVGDEALADLEVIVGFDDAWPPRSPASRTESTAYSPRSTPRWSAPSAAGWTTRPSWSCCPGSVAPPGCVPPGGAG